MSESLIWVREITNEEGAHAFNSWYAFGALFCKFPSGVILQFDYNWMVDASNEQEFNDQINQQLQLENVQW